MEELVKRLRELHPEEFGDAWDFAFACQQAMHEAADAIEVQDKHILTLQHQMMAEAESHIADVNRLDKQIEELQADARPVVTCERCIYHVDCGYHYCNKWCVNCPDDADFFCAYGEEES